jgi:hypothetical protein
VTTSTFRQNETVPRLNGARLWAGGVATAIVAALIVLVGLSVARGIFAQQACHRDDQPGRRHRHRLAADRRGEKRGPAPAGSARALSELPTGGKLK